MGGTGGIGGANGSWHDDPLDDEIIEAELVDDDEPLPPRAAAGPAEGPSGHRRPGRAGGGASAPPPGGRRASTPPPSEPRHAAKPEQPEEPSGTPPVVNRRRFLTWAAGGAAVIAGASTGAILWGGGDGGTSVRADPAGAPPTYFPPAPPVAPLRLSLMDSSLPNDQLAALQSDLQQSGGRVRLDVESLPAAGYAEGLLGRLRGPQPPDVFEVDLLSLAGHFAAGRIADMTAFQGRFDTDAWLPALRSAARVGDKLVALPMTASVPVVLYHVGLYAAAGVAVPRTREEWVDGLERLRVANAANPAFRSLYLPGKAWPVLSSFMWEAGGALALREGDTWRGAFDLPGSIEGVRFFRELQSYAPEARDLTEGDFLPGDWFRSGATGSMIGSAALHTAAMSSVPSLEGTLGAFPMPGPLPDKPGAVGVRGTALVVSSNCHDLHGAAEVLAALASDPWRAKVAALGRVNSPRTVPESAVPGQNPMLRAGAVAAAQNGHAYPVAPGWSERPVVDFGHAVLTGGDALVAAAAANQVVAAEFGKASA
ncbi:ABC transporter substrate-binding protein [Yinghuangia seranimata]|uniref:ABC transporter substrate-binding protein n=1 Tax=Yinghuangia seranimata TaxID=408067 RepID=UPI00248C9A5D|nr:extracellular solute-binding protein [Yinghuangia seranimata]MDI2125924.1 extracellular solute-binding protein [Yinghuangia seranimata]